MDAREMTPKDFSRFVADYVNSHGGTDFKEVANAFVNEHRTLQQGFFRLVYCIMKKEEEMFDNGYFDARNEGSCKFSKEALNMIEEKGIYFPYI